MPEPQLENSINQSEVMTKKSLFSKLSAKVFSFGPLFLLTVVLPTSLAILYFGFIASDVYVSESRFVVRSPDKPAATGLGVLLKTAGFSSAGDEIYAANDYVKSRDALRSLNRADAFRHAYDQSTVSWMDRFGSSLTGDAFEDLYRYYTKKIQISYDTSSSITSLIVRAYNPQDAKRFNEQLLEMAEATVNRLSSRGREDLIRYAEVEVSDAKKKASNAAVALSTFRNKEGVIDPERQATVQLQMISKLQDELIATRTQLLQLRSFTPKNPQVEVLEARVRGLTDESEKELAKLAGAGRSLSTRAVEYQRLSLDNSFAEKQLAGAMASLEEAKNEARRKQAYVERIVQPNLPDQALEPRRMRGVIATVALGVVAWGILSMLLAGVREHQD